ncbi:MAG: hypothetical protein JW818_08825 [Pirellulales bacterium]|nr:hypothetical protein [Pirellulales bacterium]
MKSERRHELKHNELADWLTHVIDKVQPYTNTILAVLLVVVIVGVATSFWLHHSRAETARAWTEFYQGLGQGRAALLKVAEDHPATEVGEWSELLIGDIALDRGNAALFTSRVEANRELDRAATCYGTVLGERKNPALVERATFGLARVHEAKGELDRARKRYEEVLKQWPDGAYAKQAEYRLTALARSSTKNFCDKFATYNPSAALMGEPGTPGKTFSLDPDTIMPPGGSSSGGGLMDSLKSSGLDGLTPSGDLPPAETGELNSTPGKTDEKEKTPGDKTPDMKTGNVGVISPEVPDTVPPMSAPPKETPPSPAMPAQQPPKSDAPKTLPPKEADAPAKAGKS